MGISNAQFLADLIHNVPDDEMRRKYQQGLYGKLRAEYVKGWRRLAGRLEKGDLP
jgi:hypothetical protein